MVMEDRALRRYSYRYFFKLYVLDTYINLNAGFIKSEVLDAIRGKTNRTLTIHSTLLLIDLNPYYAFLLPGPG